MTVSFFALVNHKRKYNTKAKKNSAIRGSYEKTDYDFTIYIDYIIYLYII